MLAKNKSGWTLLEYLDIPEEQISEFEPVTGAYAILRVGENFVIGYNRWRKQWEFPAGGIAEGETAREAAVRELQEETHQKTDNLKFKGLFKVSDADGKTKYQAVFVCEQNALKAFVRCEDDEMEEIMLWDRKKAIGYVDACDVKIAEMVCIEQHPKLRKANRNLQ